MTEALAVMDSALSAAGVTALVVDDVSLLCELVAGVLHKAGYRVLKATNGPDALELARGVETIDLLVSDIDMPHMRGDELASDLVRLHPEVALLFMSGVTSRIEAPEPFLFLAKPFNVSSLCAAATQALQMRQQQLATPASCSKIA